MARRSRPEPPPLGGDSSGLLQSRFGRRLLALFVVCALVPTCVVAVLSFQSVTSQLADQSRERLHAMAGAIGRTVFSRLMALEHDLRQADLRPSRCRREAGRFTADDDSEVCGGSLAIGFRSLAAISPMTGEPSPLFGELPELEFLSALPGGPIEPGRSALVTRRDALGVPRIYIVHRRDGPGPGYLVVGETYLPALWGEGDTQSLPATVELTIWDELLGTLLDSGEDTLVVVDQVLDEMTRSPTGSFEWTGVGGNSYAAYWTLPQTTRFRVPPLRIVLSEREEFVIAPMAQFSETFPLVLLASLGVVVVLGMSQIRRSVLPLAALRQGTSRIAERQFDSRVAIRSGDELEELGAAFNTMAAQLGRQFTALSTAAELDRAVLSSVDTSRIVDTVLDRLPDICDCDALSITILEPASPAGTAAVWVAEPDRPARRWPAPISLTSADMEAARHSRERLVVPLSGTGVPGYLRCLLSEAPRHAVIFPLFYQDGLIGLIALRQEAGAVDEEAYVQVRRLADQVAVALSNARMMDQVRFLAFYDSLTRLPNRVLFKERLTQALGRAERGRKLVGVCFLDIDHFSRINETLGHEMGDQLVQEVAVRLSACTRRGDSVARYGEEPAVEIARLGGDEFTVMLTDLDDAQDAVRVAQRILESFAKPVRIGGHEVFATASVGLAIYPYDGTDVEDLLKNADAAMFHAKEQGRNTYRLYSSSLNAEAMARMRMEHQLRKSVEAGEFTIWYQPIVDLRTGSVTAAEALVRWQHPDLGLLNPGGFISLCEETGLIVPLGKWILGNVCEQSRIWRENGVGPLTITVNLSGRQLHSEGLVDMVRDALRTTGIPPDSLILELTESMLMDPAGQVGATIRDLSGLGVGLAIDDFGTGYSSLSYLKHFPVGTLKIDRSFVADVPGKSDAAAIVKAILALAEALGMEVVAEGVETRKQAAFLRKAGCQKLQGFLFGRPAPPAEFVEQLARRAARSRS